MKYKFISHTADIKFQAFGKNLEECFVSAFKALQEIMFKDLDIKKIKTSKKIKIEIKGLDKENLLYNFLEEFLFLLEAKNFLSVEIKKIKIEGNILKAEIIGAKATDYNFSNEVKAITYNDLFIKKEKNNYICQVVLDV